MIFYFSGNGTTEWVARQLAERLDEELCFIPDAMAEGRQFELAEGEPMGVVFPCYGWGVAPIIERFIERVDVRNVSYLYMVTTCGDDTGQTSLIFSRDVARRGFSMAAAWAVQTPETYVCLPGFRLDSDEKAARKYKAAMAQIEAIADGVRKRVCGVDDSKPGPLPWAKSHIVRPFFYSFLLSPRPFHTTERCNKCGKCVRVCPYHNIELKDGRIHWLSDCTLCLRCYHSCPSNAIQWGPFTKGKGQFRLASFVK